jgi:hypothetical protein
VHFACGEPRNAREIVLSVESSTIENAAPDIVWGAKAIGRVLNLTERQAYHRLESGQIAGARKVGSTWTGSTRALKRPFEAA